MENRGWEIGIQLSFPSLNQVCEIVMNRRTFLSWMGLGWLASFFAACASKATKKQTTSNPPRSDGFQAIGTVAELDQNGKVTTNQLAAGPVLVIRNPTNPNSLTAVNPTCPHRGCKVDWKADQKEFLCPCHSSKFASDGKLLQGPAQKPLSTYQTKIEAGTILVKAS